MKIAIIGYGRMGHEIERIALHRNHKISYIIDAQNQDDLLKMNKFDTDVAIEFSMPTEANRNILQCFEANIPVVSGTTGWAEKLNELKQLSIKQKKGFLYASNFSIGVNVLFSLNTMLARLMNAFPDYQVQIKETHHTRKLDSPSGTAISLADGIVKNSERLSRWEETDHPQSGTLGIQSYRIGEVPGIHEIIYESSFDSIELRHSAKNRQGFALGAVLAAEFMQNKTSFYEMKDVLKLG